jgi:hypothetical protein
MKEILRKTLGKAGLLEPIRAARRKLTPAPKLPSDIEKRRILLDHQKKYRTNIFIETGTFLGDTSAALLPVSSKVFSIELSEQLAARARKRFAKEPRISIIHGDSGERLADIVKDLNEPALFWLDGHYSSSFDYNGEYFHTAKGKLETPILAELDVVMASNFPHIILIDDARCFNGSNDYPTCADIKAFVHKRRPEFTLSVKRDIIRILPPR